VARLPFNFPHQRRLGLGNRNGARGADLDATLATQAFVLVHRVRFVAFHLKDAHRTDVNAFFIAGTFVFVNFNPPSHLTYLLRFPTIFQNIPKICKSENRGTFLEKIPGRLRRSMVMQK
jgi:hypothetical protein